MDEQPASPNIPAKTVTNMKLRDKLSDLIRLPGPDVPEAARTEFSVVYPLGYTARLISTTCREDLETDVFTKCTSDKLRVESKSGSSDPHLVASVDLRSYSNGVSQVRVRVSPIETEDSLLDLVDVF
jgi:hypothetical protein